VLAEDCRSAPRAGQGPAKRCVWTPGRPCAAPYTVRSWQKPLQGRRSFCKRDCRCTLAPSSVSSGTTSDAVATARSNRRKPLATASFMKTPLSYRGRCRAFAAGALFVGAVGRSIRIVRRNRAQFALHRVELGATMRMARPGREVFAPPGSCRPRRVTMAMRWTFSGASWRQIWRGTDIAFRMARRSSPLQSYRALVVIVDPCSHRRADAS